MDQNSLLLEKGDMIYCHQFYRIHEGGTGLRIRSSFSEKDNLKERVLLPEEETKLLDSCPECLRTIVLTAIHTGMRRAEILNLKWEDVNLEKREIKVRKTKSGRIRTIPINEKLFSRLSTLKHKKGSSNYLFNNAQTGQPLKDLKKAFKGV